MRKGFLIYEEMRKYLTIYSTVWGGRKSYVTLKPIPSEFPYIWEKFYFIFYQCKFPETAKGLLVNFTQYLLVQKLIKGQMLHKYLDFRVDKYPKISYFLYCTFWTEIFWKLLLYFYKKLYAKSTPVCFYVLLFQLTTYWETRLICHVINSMQRRR